MKSKIVLTQVAVIAFVAALTLQVRLAAQDQQDDKNEPHRYTVIDLGTLGGTFAQAFGINNNGDVVGWSNTVGDLATHAFLWRQGTMIDLTTLGGPTSLATSISDEREVVGVSELSTADPLGEDFCAFGDHLICRPFVWRDGIMTPLPTVGGNNGQALSINNRGVIVGISENTVHDPTCVAPQVLQIKPVVWEEREVDKLPTLPGDHDGIAGTINDRGHVVGVSTNCTQNPSRAVIWRDDKVTDLTNLGGTSPAPNDLNNEDQVVGISDLPGGTISHAFLWQKGVISDLGTLPGDVNSFGNAINDTEQVVGQSCDKNGFMNCSAFLWEKGVKTDLNKLISGTSSLHLFDPGDINSRGEIVGLAIQKTTGELRAFLAIPCDEGPADRASCEADVKGDASSAINERPNMPPPANVPNRLRHRLGHRHHSSY